jgi:RND family efflux transporter MFP subunit
MKTGWLRVFSLGVASAIAGATCCSLQPAGAAGNDVNDERLESVPTLAPVRAALGRSTTQPATVHAFYEAHIFARISGFLAELNVDIGASVSQGDVLAVVAVPEMLKQREAKQADIRRLEAEERRAQAYLAVARANADSYGARLSKAKADVAKADASLTAVRIERDRMTNLVQQRAVADRLLDEAREKLEAAEAGKTSAEATVISAAAELSLSQSQATASEADLEVAKATTDVARRELDELDELIKYATLTAPFDGVVTERHVDPGDLVRDTQTGSGSAGTPLFVVRRLDHIRVRVAVPERDTPLVDVGDAAQISLQALPGQALTGKVSRLSRVLDEQTRTMLVEIDLANPKGKLLPGMFGQATITLDPPRERLMLPAAAVRYDEVGNSFVYVVNSASEIDVVSVQTGIDDGKLVEITSGLTGNERVVGPLLPRLKPGQKVRVES